MARGPADRSMTGRGLRRVAAASLLPVVLGALAVVALMTALAGHALVDGGAPIIATTTATTATTVATVALDPSAPPAVESSDRGVVGEVVQAADVIVPVQLAPVLRVRTRVGGEARTILVVLTGLLLALIGRRTVGRRPALAPIPASAAPGLQVRRRGPPPR